MAIFWPDLCRIRCNGQRGLSKGISITAIRGIRCRMVSHQCHSRHHLRKSLWLALADTSSDFGTGSFLHDSILALRRSSAFAAVALPTRCAIRQSPGVSCHSQLVKNRHYAQNPSMSVIA